MAIRRAMVLAAGFGRRLAPLTDTCPKPLMPLGGARLLDHILAFLRDGGIEEVVINLHHLSQRIEEHVGDGRRFGLRIHYSPEDPILDTGGGILRARRWLDGEAFVVANGDSLLELPLSEVIAHHESDGPSVTMVLRARADGETFGAVEVDAEGLVRRIVGLPPSTPSSGLTPFTFPGLHVLTPDVFQWMPDGGAFSITRETYPRMIAAGLGIRAFITSARWLTIDTAPALAAAQAEFDRAPFAHRAPFEPALP